MRAITVDTKSLFFFVKMLFFTSFFAVVWYVFVPTQHFFLTKSEEKEILNTSNISATGQDTNMTSALQVLAYRGKHIVVDVTNMRVSTYDGEYVLESFEMQSTPSEPSPFILTEGVYAVEEKATVETSAIGMVRFPYTVTFGEGFSLHGVPTDAEGLYLEEKYHGGQIELRTEDAKRVYDFVAVGTPVYVRTQVLGKQTSPALLSVEYENLPATSAQSYALTDVSTGQTILSKKGNDRYPVASITKLVTAVVANDVIGHSVDVLAPDGQYYTLSDLYYPLMLRSDNKVAESIAVHAGKGYFMGNMNAYVKALAMEQTSFYDSSGLSPKNISTAVDLSILARHLYAEKSFLLAITKEESVTITSTQGEVWNMKNQNTLSGDPYFLGGKLGYTDEAGQTALSVFTIPLNDEVRVVSVVVLNSKDWKQDTRTLLRWLEENIHE